MIKITVELWPHGVESRKKTIAEGYIVNDGTGTMKKGNYEWKLKLNKVVVATGTVKNWDRLLKNVWALIARVLRQAKL